MGGFQVIIQVSALVGFWGAFVSHAVIPSTSDLQWQIPVTIQLVPGAILLLGTLFIPETPRYKAEKGQWEEAEDAISWLRGVPKSDHVVEDEIQEIRLTIQANARVQMMHQESFWTEITKRGIRNRLGVGVGLMVAQNIVVSPSPVPASSECEMLICACASSQGLNALNYFSPIIFQSAGFTTVSSSLLLTGIFGVVKLLAAFAFMFYCVKTKGNRYWLQLGSGVCAISMLVLAYCVRSFPPQEEMHEGAITVGGMVAVLMVYLFTFAFQISLGPISWNVCGEVRFLPLPLPLNSTWVYGQILTKCQIFPLHLNTKCCAITTCTQWLFQAALAAATPFMLAWSGWLTYLIYGCCCILTLAWIYLCVPETRDVPLGQPMNEIFGMRDADEAVIDECSALLSNEHRRKASIASLN